MHVLHGQLAQVEQAINSFEPVQQTTSLQDAVNDAVNNNINEEQVNGAQDHFSPTSSATDIHADLAVETPYAVQEQEESQLTPQQKEEAKNRWEAL